MRRGKALLVALLLCWLLGWDGQAAFASTFAVVVGNNQGLSGEPALEYAEADARRFHQLLLEVSTVTPQGARLVLGQDAQSLREQLQAVHRTLQALGPGKAKSFVLYISAHADAEALHLGHSRFPLSELRARLDALPVTFRLAIIDACRTPVRTKGGQPRSVEVPVTLELPSRLEGTLFLMSTTEGEPAQEWPYLRGSLFTHHLLAALRGLGDVDGNGAVTLGEAYAYSYRNTLSQSLLGSAGAQHPSFDAVVKGRGDWVFSRPARASSFLVLDAELDGTFWVADDRAELIADVKKARGTQTRLAVRAGRYRIVQPRRTVAEAADVGVPARGERVVRARDLIQVPLERVRLRGASPLVLRPWELGVGYALSSEPVSGAGPVHFVETSLLHHRASLFLRARVGYTRFRFHVEDLQVRQEELQLGLGGGWELFRYPVSVSLGLEARGSLVGQQVRRPDAQQAGVVGVVEPRRVDQVYGAAVFGALGVPVTERLRLITELSVAVSRFPRWDGTLLYPASGQVRVGVSWAL